MADKLISELTSLTTGNIENSDLVEIQEDDQLVTKKVTVAVLNELEAAARAAQDDVIELGAGLNTDGTYNTPSGTNYIDGATSIHDATELLDAAIGNVGNIVTEIITISAANLNNSGVTPYEIVAAPGSTKWIEVIACSARVDYNGIAPTWAAGSPKPVLQYDTGANHFMEWSNAFITATADTINKGTWTSEVAIILNKKVELTFDTGTNPTGGDSTLKVAITYRIWDYSAT